MWQRKRMELWTKAVEEQLSIRRRSSHHLQQDSWTSTRMALNYNPDYRGFPSQIHNNREATNPARCCCDTCSLINAQEMDRYYTAQGQPPLYLTSWPMVMQPHSHKQGLYPAQGSYLQPQYQERSQPPIHPRGAPLIFTQPTHLERPFHPPIPTEPQHIQHPACYPESRTYPLTEIHNIPSDLSPPPTFKTSTTLTSKGSISSTPLRPGGVAYDHHDLPKIVSVHSLPSSPVFVSEQLQGATLLPLESKLPTVYAEESACSDTITYPRSSPKVCLENRYSSIDPKTEYTLAETEKTSDPSEKTAEYMKIEDNDKDQSTKSLDKCEAVSPNAQLPESPKYYMAKHQNEAKTVTNVGQEEAAQPKDVIDREMMIRRLLRMINAWQIDFNQETDDIKKFKILNQILEARAKLEKLRLNRDGTNTPKARELPTDGGKDSSKVNEVTVGIVTKNEDVEETTMETKNDIPRTSSNFESMSDFVTSRNISSETRMKSPNITMETAPKITMATKSDKVTATKITKDTPSDGAAPPKITMETESDVRMLSPEINMETEIDGEETPNATMETNSNSAEQESDAICTNMTSSFCAETNTSSIMETNTDVVSNANATITMTSTNATMITSNSNIGNKTDTMRVTVDNDPSSLPEDSASLLSSFANPCQTSPKILDKTTLLQPRILVNLFDRVKLFDRRKKLVGPDETSPEKPEDQEENYCAKNMMNREKNSSNNASASENSISDKKHNQIDGELSTNREGSQRLSPGLSNIIKDPLATTEIRRKKHAGDCKVTESDSDDVWTMELDESSHKAVFRRRWKRTGGPSDQKRSAFESLLTDGTEIQGLTEGKEWFSRLPESSPPPKKRALLELRIIEDEDEVDDNDERIINEAIKISPIFKTLASGRLKRAIQSNQDPTSSIYPTDDIDRPTQDLLLSDLEVSDSPSNENSLYSQDGGVKEMAALSGDDGEENIFIPERSSQLRESKIHRLNEKKEQLLEELKRIKANPPSSVPRDL
ncbi:uncharacterized protein LOC116308567 isoform X2 [Actinia tenebrosa]|uniref:Uncharacterized protein LOC116308567 isoform X2 n=1 Tax=Actinia tenebrosa TaxID=6105 RepID=A0A6P8J4C9_ACTTE|nr:uncharacterized protein LOC116308567 isoform X2 [Actinia tenebrosa]